MKRFKKIYCLSFICTLKYKCLNKLQTLFYVFQLDADHIYILNPN